MPRPSTLLLLIPVLLALPRPARAAFGAPFAGEIDFSALREIQAQLRQAADTPQIHDPLVIPDVNFGDKRAARYRFQRKDEVFYLDGDKRPVSIGWELSDVVETEGGTVERLLSVEGGPNLTTEGAAELVKEKQKAATEGQRLSKLLGDNKAKSKLMKKEKSDADGLEQMVAEFPRALRYTFEGVETGADGETLLRESFESNDCSHTPHVDPCFTPHSQEARIYEGMKGTMWIRERDRHLSRLVTSIQHDVKFGWGPFSATAKAGGYIAITMSDIDGTGRRWILSALEDHLVIEKSAIAALFSGGTERDNDHQAMLGFRTVGAMSFDQGLELLRSER
ncbi:MAG: hypothetical protein ACHQ2Z_15370 [Elusimicrobiota bacterium]